MAEQVQKTKLRDKDVEEHIEDIQATKRAEDAQAVTDDTADLLDEIDAVLEENAELFVNSYIQKGGE